MQKATLKTLLREHGFSSINAELWSEFVRQVIAIYSQAVDQLLTPERWEEFKQKRGALGVLKKRKKKPSTQAPLEDAITSEIGQLADELRKNLAPEHFLRKHDVHFGYETLIPSKTRAGRHSKKADFRVASTFPNAPELVIEAKPLMSESDIEKKYLAQEGIGCFFTKDSPYTKGPLGAMFAYTINNDNASMQELILKGLGNCQPAALSIKRVSVSSKDIIDCSHHDRSAWGLIPISILHLERIFPVDVHEASEKEDELETFLG